MKHSSKFKISIFFYILIWLLLFCLVGCGSGRISKITEYFAPSVTDPNQMVMVKREITQGKIERYWTDITVDGFDLKLEGVGSFSVNKAVLDSEEAAGVVGAVTEGVVGAVVGGGL